VEELSSGDLGMLGAKEVDAPAKTEDVEEVGKVGTGGR
jgi:hypothetical protein